MTINFFKKRKNIEQVEEATEFAPKFGKDGLIPVVTTDYKSGEVLMQAYMNKVSLTKTIKLGEAVYFSRSSKSLWHKGKISGLIQKVKEIYQNLPNLSIHDEPLDPSENDNSSEPVWHYKYEMDEKVAEMLSLSPEEIGEKNSCSK